MPSSSKVGTSGTIGLRAALAAASGRSLPAWISAQQRRHRIEHDVDAAGADVDHRRAAAAIGHVQHLDAGDVLEQLARQMRRAAVAGRRERQLARDWPWRRRSPPAPTSSGGSALIVMISGRLATQDDRREILHRVVRQAGVEVRADAVGGDGVEQQRVAVGRGLGDVVRRDGAAGAAAVADDDRLAQRLRQLLADQRGR